MWNAFHECEKTKESKDTDYWMIAKEVLAFDLLSKIKEKRYLVSQGGLEIINYLLK